MKLANNSLIRKIGYFFAFAIPSLFTQYAEAVDLNLLCTLKSFCKERAANSCENATSEIAEPVQHVKINNNFVEYWGDTFKIFKISNDSIDARRSEKYPEHGSRNDSLLILNRYTGIMDLTHTLHVISKPSEETNNTQINRVRYECIKTEARF